MKLCFIDFETQGVEASTTHVTEVGASLYELHGGSHQKIWGVSQLVYDPSYPPQTEEIVELTGITDEMLKKEGKPLSLALDALESVVPSVDFMMAHNKAFDKTVYDAAHARCGRTTPYPKGGWICTVQDVPWAAKYRCKKLSHLAFDHGIVRDPSKLHRAEYDTDLLAELILTKCDINEIIEYWKTPWVTIFLNGVKPPWTDGGVSNGQAKKLGYGWQKAPGTDGPEFDKRWVKRVKENQLEAEKARTPAHFTLTKQTGNG